LHLFLLCLLCAAGVGIGNFFMVRYKWRAAYHEFNDIFGTGIEFTRKGILPNEAPEKSRRQELPFESLIIYVSPEAGAEEYPDETLERRNVIIFWGSSCIAAFVRNDNMWEKVVQYEPQGNVQQSLGVMTYDEMRRDLQELCSKPCSDQWTFPEEYERNGMSSQQLFYLARLSFAIAKGVIYFLLSLCTVFLVTLLFSFIFKLFSVGGTIYGFLELWKISIYAAFPVIFVVNFFPALQLPGTGYFSWLFMIGWVIYLFVVLRFLFQSYDNEDNNDGEANERA
jgi:hypothetical protein